MPTLGTAQLTSAVTNSVVTTVTGLTNMNRLHLAARFTYVTSGSPSPTLKVNVLTSLDEGSNWFTIATFAFGEASANKYLSCIGTKGVNATVALTSVALSDDTSINDLLGDRIRMTVTSTNDYASGTSVTVDYSVDSSA